MYQKLKEQYLNLEKTQNEQYLEHNINTSWTKLDCCIFITYNKKKYFLFFSIDIYYNNVYLYIQDA